MWMNRVYAHETEEQLSVVPQPLLDQIIRTNSLNFTYLALGLIVLLVALSILLKNKTEWLKLILFITMALIILANTIYLSGSTIYLNQVSVTGGPVHYHADFEIYNCGVKVEIKDPQWFSNQVGTEVVHEHNDNRMHIEGVLLDKHDTSISHFFEQLGGSMRNTYLTVPTNEGDLTLRNGERCLDGKNGILQVFVYKTDGETFRQTKLTDPQNYQISPESNVPPGDCIILEFDSINRTKTDKLCQNYKLAKELEKIHD